jgi:outer membrane protein TolC
LELVRLRHALGDASAADVEAAYAQWTAVNALIPDIEARQRAAVLSLGVLLGAPPERELALLDSPLAPSTLRALPVGERADMLRRRPDVLAAERRLAASSADIGVATAELFPKLSIGVGGGFQALSTGDWFDASSARFSILPMISWRLFDGGRVRAEIRAREAAERQAALAYEQAVLAALGDAERALVDYHSGLDTLARRGMSLDAARTSYGHARTRYAAGDIALVELLAAQRSLHEAETAAARAHTNAAVQLVALYKALGGGWDVSTAAPTATHSLRGATAPLAFSSR